MSLYISSTDVSKLYLGNQEVEKVYLGSELVYQTIQPTVYTYGFTNQREDDFVIDSSGEYITFNISSSNYNYPCYYALGDDYVAALESANYLRYDARIRWKEEGTNAIYFNILALATSSSGNGSVTNSQQLNGRCWGTLATYNNFSFRQYRSNRSDIDLADVQAVYPSLPTDNLLELGWIDLRVEIIAGKLEYKFKLPSDTDYVTVKSYENSSIYIPSSDYNYITFGGTDSPSSVVVDIDLPHTGITLGKSADEITYEWKAAQEPVQVNGTLNVYVANPGLTPNYYLIVDGQTTEAQTITAPIGTEVQIQIGTAGYETINDTHVITQPNQGLTYYMMRNNYSGASANICVSDAGITRNTNGQIDFGEVVNPFLYLETPFDPKDLAVNGSIVYQISFRDAGDFKMGFFENWSEAALAIDTIPEFDGGTVLARKAMPGQTGESINLNLGQLYSTGVAVAVQLTKTAADSYSITIIRMYNMDSGEPTQDTVWSQSYTQQDWDAIFPGSKYYFFVTSLGGLYTTINAKITGGMVMVGSTQCQWTSSNTIDVGA